MDIQDLISKGVNVTISVTLADLVAFHAFVIEDTRQKLEQSVIDGKAEAYLSPKNVSQMLDVDLTTLWRWNQKGYLTHVEIGGKRRYLMSDIRTLLAKKE